MFAIYFTLPLVALSALPVYKDASGEFVTKLGLPPDQGGFENDPVLGLVKNLGLHGALLSAAEVYVGVLAATILFIATNAGVIGASRITYSMSSYRQLPEVFRRLHPKLKTPWLSLIVFGGALPILFVLSGRVGFLGRMYAFGAMLSFTIAHASVIALRVKTPDAEIPWRARPNLRIRGVSWPLFALLGGLATGIAWLVVVVQDPATRYAGFAWLAVGFVFYPLYRRHLHAAARGDRPRADRARAGGRARVQEHPRPGRARPRDRGGARRRVPSRDGAARPRRGVAVVEVPLELPLDAAMPEAEAEANELLDYARTVGDSYGVDVDRAHRARPPRRARDRARGRAAKQRDHRHGRAAARKRAQAPSSAARPTTC